MNICLQTNTFPAMLKRAVVKPIYKAGDKQNFNNYRPISLLPVISKLLEKLIYVRVIEHLVSNSVLNERQFGFRKGMSTYQSMEWTGSIRWIHNSVQSRRIWIGLDQKFTNSADSGLDWIQKCAMCIPYLET